MPGKHAPPSSNTGSSSSNGTIRDESIGSDEHKRIVELSEIIIHEIDSNTWLKNPRGAQTIFRVPKERLHDADKCTYQPTFLSIGPYHRGEDATEEMQRNEQGKLLWLGSVAKDAGPSVLQLTQAVASMEARARSCYEGDVQMERDAFCRMLLLDAVQLVFLVQLLGHGGVVAQGRSKETDGASQGCNMIKTRDLRLTVHDLMMLENQIPFFVVEKVYELIHSSSTGDDDADAAAEGDGSVVPVARLAWGTIGAIMADVPPALDDGVDKCKHLVHLCHAYLKPSSAANETCAGEYGRFRRATEYYEAGVSFRRWSANDGSRRPLLDVRFSDGALRMALQSVDEKTGYVLRNVLAYEQKYYRAATDAGESYVTAYVVFMSQLLSSPEDVALLSGRGVMEHLLGNDAEVCALFRGLADGLVFDPAGEHYLNPVGVALQGHCRSRLHRWGAWIMRHRFSNPWLVAAWVFGAAAVLGTIVQTVYTVLSYYR